jgi:hypothetical protein
MSSPPAAPPAPATSSPPPSPQSPDAWTDFVAFVSKERRLLGPHLEECLLAEVRDGTMELAVPKGFHHEYLARREMLNALEELAGRFYGRPMKLALRVSEASLRPAKPAVDPTKLKQDALEDPKVRSALEILGGEVRDVKPRNAQGE